MPGETLELAYERESGAGRFTLADEVWRKHHLQEHDCDESSTEAALHGSDMFARTKHIHVVSLYVIDGSAYHLFLLL
jgi:hypothetical protein